MPISFEDALQTISRLVTRPRPRLLGRAVYAAALVLADDLDVEPLAPNRRAPLALALRSIAWEVTHDPMRWTCRSCQARAEWPDSPKHKPNCQIVQLLRALRMGNDAWEIK